MSPNARPASAPTPQNHAWRARPRPGRRLALLWCAGVAAACTTNFDARQGVDVQSTAADSVDVPPSAMRRLTHSEYNRTVEALLGTHQTPADAFPPDPVADGFDNNADAQVLTPADIEAHFNAAVALADEATDGDGLATLAPCAQGADPSACLSAFAQSFAPRAWRRPVDDDELQALLASTSAESYPQRVADVITAALISPTFIFLADPGQKPVAGGAAARRSAWALASQLSYFLWSAPPDATLAAAASDGSILGDARLTQEVDRMLADPRAAALVDDFAGQWMRLSQTRALVPDPKLFPTWNPNLRDDMLAQTRMSLADLVAGKLALNDLFAGASTYLNADLAAYYGLPPVVGTALIPTTLAAGSRRGLLGQGAILANSSFARRTSITRRGAFVLEQLVCSPTGPPPNVQGLADNTVTEGSQRTLMEAHITIPACAVCHKSLDPYGYVLESFDAVGAPRTQDNGYPIDSNADLPDGTHVATVEELGRHLAQDARVPACAVRKMYTYALGRTVVDADTQTLSGLFSTFTAGGQLLPPLIARLVLSDPFRFRKSA